MVSQEQIDRFNEVCRAAFEKSDADCMAVLEGNQEVILRLREEAGLSEAEMIEVISHNSNGGNTERQRRKTEEALRLASERMVDFNIYQQKEIKPGDRVFLRPSVLAVTDRDLKIIVI